MKRSFAKRSNERRLEDPLLLGFDAGKNLITIDPLSISKKNHYFHKVSVLSLIYDCNICQFMHFS